MQALWDASKRLANSPLWWFRIAALALLVWNALEIRKGRSDADFAGSSAYLAGEAARAAESAAEAAKEQAAAAYRACRYR
jgi:hypothetical protein